MHNRKIIARGLAFGIVLSNVPVDSMASAVEEYKIIKEDNGFKVPKKDEEKKTFERVSKINNSVKVNTNIIDGSVLKVTVGDGEYVPDLTGNPDGYETIKVTTTGNKKLVSNDYTNLRKSGIPKIDLSNSFSDYISSNAFTDATHLTEFKFPKGVVTIESSGGWSNFGPFRNCVNLTGDLIIPDTVKTIGRDAFNGCSGFTGDLIIPDSVKTIQDSAFKGCSGFTGNLVLPTSITSIEYDTFKGCSGLTGNLVIPDLVTNIGSSAFNGCSGLTGELVLPDLITDIGSSAFRNCSGFTGELVIPTSLTVLKDRVFAGCTGFTGELIIPNSIVTIGETFYDYGTGGTFAGCTGFTSLTLSDNLTVIGNNVFKGCTGFVGELIIPTSVEQIRVGAFSGCTGFTSLRLYEGLEEIGSDAFYRCSGLSGNLIIPSTVSNIGYRAFSGCRGFTGNLVIPNSVTNISGDAFYDCIGFVGDLIVPDSVISLSRDAFRNTNIGKIIVQINESHKDVNYKKNIVENLPLKNTYLEMSYNFDYNGTWLDFTKYIISRPEIETYAGKFKNNNEGTYSTHFLDKN